MSEPQINEVWEREEKASTGVIMSPVQYEKFMEKMEFITDETTRREKAVAEALIDLKRVEVVKTYGNFVRDITMSLQTLANVPNTEAARDSLLKSLAMANESFNPAGVLGHEQKETLQSGSLLSIQTNQTTTQDAEKVSKRLHISQNAIE
jgi:hypothetical protein